MKRRTRCHGLLQFLMTFCLPIVAPALGLAVSLASPVPALVKNMRQQELWLKYRFHCTCERCEEKFTNTVDKILEKVGLAENQSKIHTSEDWLREEIDRGLRELFESDNSLSCCKILEGALQKVLYDANVGSLPLPESLDYGCDASDTRNAKYIKVHLMHHLCLEIFLALSTSYRILGAGYGSPLLSDAVENCNISVGTGKRIQIERHAASTAYSLVQAIIIQNLCDFGESGVLVVAFRFWLQTSEAFISLIVMLDSYFGLKSISHMKNLHRRFKSFILLSEDESLQMIKRILKLRTDVQNCDSTVQLFQCSTTALWPFLKSCSPFLLHTDSPFNINMLSTASFVKQKGIFYSRDDWLHFRDDAFICAVCSLRYGFKLGNILHGLPERQLEVVHKFLSSCLYHLSIT
ncbi:hypothetical protein KP509_22G005700 [Ceratopteris richardii]|uniref:Uncharacterized protein n=1 Tax=Ceratopteris richardii TaxID=49495 RepID=A0A8T2S2C2_CERRI|nr:hypothetical protein KP509_22G005700 [Ceratopteris richardii]